MIIVLGTGRSGTSEVSGILRSLGVDMGSNFDRKQPSDKGEYSPYEDLDFVNLNIKCAPSFFKTYLDELIKSKKEPFGVKDPNIIYKINYYLKYKPQIIYCARDKNETIQSMVKNYNWTYNTAKKFVEDRIRRTERVILNRDYLRIDFYEKNKIKKIKEWLKI